MKRTHFLKNMLGLGLLSFWGCQTDREEPKPAALAGIGGTLEKEKVADIFSDKEGKDEKEEEEEKAS